jgi:hypothetical protein
VLGLGREASVGLKLRTRNFVTPGDLLGVTPLSSPSSLVHSGAPHASHSPSFRRSDSATDPLSGM